VCLLFGLRRVLALLLPGLLCAFVLLGLLHLHHIPLLPGLRIPLLPGSLQLLVLLALLRRLLTLLCLYEQLIHLEALVFKLRQTVDAAARSDAVRVHPY
jgi:hypothetical protein